MLYLLDAEAAGETVADTEIALLHEAKSMTHSGYLGILRLADSRQRPQ
jgi:hypothetical protein